MSLLKHLLLTQGAGAGKPEVVFPMEYVFTEGTGLYSVMYDDPEGSGPYTVATNENPQATIHNLQRKLVRTSDGNLYAVYNKKLAGEFQLYVKKSVDDGANWTDETRISTYEGMESYEQKSPSIAVDSSDHLHVVWGGGATGYTKREIWHALYDGSWHTPVRISTYAGMDEEYTSISTIAVDSSDHLHVVFHGYATGYESNYQIWYALYDGSWHTPVRISTYAGMESKLEFYPSIAIDSSDHLHVVWSGGATGYTVGQIQVWHALYDGSWHTPVRISTYAGMESYEQQFPSIAVDSSDHLHVVWNGYATGYESNYQIWYALYDGSWHTPVRISTYAGMDENDQEYPSIAVDSSDHLHVVWHGEATGYGTTTVWYAKYTDSWADPECLQPTGKNQYPNLRWSRWP